MPAKLMLLFVGNVLDVAIVTSSSSTFLRLVGYDEVAELTKNVKLSLDVVFLFATRNDDAGESCSMFVLGAARMAQVIYCCAFWRMK